MSKILSLQQVTHANYDALAVKLKKKLPNSMPQFTEQSMEQ